MALDHEPEPDDVEELGDHHVPADLIELHEALEAGGHAPPR